MSKTAPEWVTQEGWAPTCSFCTYPGSVQSMEPPEFCENDVVPDTNFCLLHTDEEPYLDEYGSFRDCYEGDFDPDTDFELDDYMEEWH